MKLNKYWVKEEYQITVNKQRETIHVWGGSNSSESDARENARIKAEKIQTKINSGSLDEAYEVAIREHIVTEINSSNVVTVCRYGAQVLNTEQYTILDLDDYPVDFFDIFRGLSKMSKKERIVHKFKQKLKKRPQLGDDFRIYETAKGIRVIGKKYVSPQDKKYRSLMRFFYVDWIYIEMSRKQNCYRARLTPKPYRMRGKTFRVTSPLICETPEYKEWSTEYQQRSQNFSVVRLIETIGSNFSMDPVIRLHDKTCNMSANKKLV